MRSALQSGYKMVSKKAKPDHLPRRDDMERLKERFWHHSNLSLNPGPATYELCGPGHFSF